MLSKLFGLFPDGILKNKLLCFYYNYFKKSGFRISYKKRYFKLNFNDNSIKVFENPNVCGNAEFTFKRYLKHYEIKKGDVVIDAGASIGVFSLCTAKMVGSNGIVIAFEPDNSNYEILQKNVKLNNLDNIITLKKGLWSRNENLDFYNDNSETSHLIFDDVIDKSKIVKIPVVKLDDELKKLGIKKVNFIKMDIEGAEVESIKGCKNILKENKVNLAIASYHVIDGEETRISLQKIFPKLGYNNCKTFFTDHPITYASKN